MNMIEFCWCFDVVVLLLFSLSYNKISDVSPLADGIAKNKSLTSLR